MFTFFVPSFSPKAKSDEDDHQDSLSSSTTKKNEIDNQSSDASFELGKALMNPTTVHTLAIGYLESLMQIRICLQSKQKTFSCRSTST